MKGQAIKSLKMLLSCNIERLHDDGFEGSMDEYHIFRNVFFGHEDSRISQRYDVTGAINFQNDKNTLKDISFCSDSDISVMTIQEDFHNTKEDSGSGHCEEFALITRNAPDVEVKRIKMSPEEHSESKSYLEKVVKSSNPVQCSKTRWKDSSFIEIDSIEFLIPTKDSVINPKPLLRYHTYCLLKAAGWLIGKRNRNTHNKGRGEYVFKNPEGRPFREFYRAWNMCGQRLVKDSNFVGVCSGKKWTELTQFRSDLSNAFTEVEKLRNLGTITALVHWWYLLDPFAKVVFIDKSFPHLKDGKEVKAERSLVNRPESSKNVVKSEKFIKHKKEKKDKKAKKVKKDKKGSCYLKDDDLLLSAILNNRNTKKSNLHVPKGVRKYKSKKGGCRLLPNNSKKSPEIGARTVLCWLISLGIIRVNEIIQYRDPQDDTVVKDGVVSRNGILCRCCKKVFSVSQFRNHAGCYNGFSMKNTCLNLFMESGKSLTLCQLEAWSTEYKVRKSSKGVVYYDEFDKSDDTCGLCGDGGDLICCDNCPSTFHQSCLSTQELPEGNWYCSNCCCWICRNVVNHNGLKCLQCEHKYHNECITENGIEKKMVGPTWFCGEACEKIHSGLNSQIGCVNPLSDNFSWALLRCIHGDEKVHSGQNFVAIKAECNLKLAVALKIMEECFLPMVDTRTGIHMIPHVLYNWGSEYVRLNYEGFYTVVLEKDDIILSVATLRIHGAAVAELPLIATCNRYRRQGMCRRLINVIEEMLKSFKVETLVVSAIPSLVETWTHGFGFSLLEADEKKSLEKTNLMVFPGTVWLKKPMYIGPAHNNQFLGTSTDWSCNLQQPNRLMDMVSVNPKKLFQQD